MTGIFVVLILGGMAAMAWSFLAAQGLESSVADLEKRLADKDSGTSDKN
ncbi:MAG TPA: hypothetical protein PKO15_07590 [Fibrobacteria bacterium]|nr:hypothetical protein [Fibrobacteria bacterium]HOX52170.1 hypothetical protein [Fibrobacteria bacterium]